MRRVFGLVTVATKLLSRLLLSIPQLRREGYAPNYLPLVTVYYCQHQRSLALAPSFVLGSYLVRNNFKVPQFQLRAVQHA